MSEKNQYRGRFAPSPTGPLHFGSLIAATGSYLQAKSQQGEWFIRIDDIDPPREVKGAADNILFTLENFGFEWDGEVFYQSQNLQRYESAITTLLKEQLAYPCSCSRSSILKMTGLDNGHTIYPGLCRNGPLKKSADYSIRLRSNNHLVCFDDKIQGKHKVNVEKTNGDFILQRRDKHFSYHLASGIDDAEQGISEVVRGKDLLECTPCQIYVQQTLNLATPDYCHLPIAVNESGQKLSKQTYAEALNTENSVHLLYKTLKFLGQMPPKQLINASQEELWLWAKTHWRLDRVPKESHQPYV